jgi:hypothetical protein
MSPEVEGTFITETLTAAITTGQVGIAKFLLSPPYFETYNKHYGRLGTILMYCKIVIQYDREDIFRLLLQNISIQTLLRVGDEHKYNSFHLILIPLLIENQKPQLLKCLFTSPRVSYVKPYMGAIECPNVLEYAIKYNHVGLFKVLLELQDTPRDQYFPSFKTRALPMACQHGKARIVEIILAHPNAFTPESWQQGLTDARRRCDMKLVKMFER